MKSIMKGMCGRCYDEGVDLFPAPCQEKPEELRGLPIGMYHCPDCGAMVVAGMEHPVVCEPCSKLEHPYMDQQRNINMNKELKKVCNRCGIYNDAKQEVCKNCGASLPDTPTK